MVPLTLTRVFIVVTSAWNVARLPYLHLVLSSLHSFPTHVDVTVVSDYPDRLQAVTAFWELPSRVVGPRSPLPHPHLLSWEHRNLTAEAHKSGNYTAFVYLEDDVLLTWPKLVAWAQDTELLAPLGFLRGFYRVEHAADSGRLMLLDSVDRVRLRNYTARLKVTSTVDGTNRHFLQLPNPYMAMWAASAAQLEGLLGTRWWNYRSSMHSKGPTAIWSVREMAAASMQFANAPPGFAAAVVVPYQRKPSPMLKPVAAIEHVANSYCTGTAAARWPCSVPVDEVFITAA